MLNEVEFSMLDQITVMQNKKQVQGHKYLRSNYGVRKIEDSESYINEVVNVNLSSAKKKMPNQAKKSRVNSYLAPNNDDLITTPRNDASSSVLKSLQSNQKKRIIIQDDFRKGKSSQAIERLVDGAISIPAIPSMSQLPTFERNAGQSV